MARKHQFTAVFLVAAAAALAGTAAAQTTSGLEEIIVTAQKREQSMQDVGIAVTAFSDKQIRELGFSDSTDIVAMTPGLIYTTPNAESSVINFFLRGVGLNDFADANENPVAVYVDDVYRPASGGLSFQLFDLQRVEVLRGPQGTLFGRNTTGGVVHFISKRPTDELDGFIDLTYGSYDQIKAEAAFGGPIGDTVSGRLSAAMNKHDGWTENRFEGAPDYNEGDSVAVRAQLQWEPSDAARILLSGNYSDNDAAVGAWQHQATTRNANGESVALGPNETTGAIDCNADLVLDDADLRTGTDCFGYRDTDGDPFEGDYDRDGRVETEASGGSLNIDWDVGDVTITSITAYQKVERLQSEDTEASPAPLIQPTFGAETTTFTQELRAAGGSDAFRWLVGGFYFDNEVEGHYLLDLTNLGFVFFDAVYEQESESMAAFGQVEFDLSDQFTVIAGARWSNDQKELDYLNIDESGLFEFLTGSPVAFDFDKNSVGDLAEHDDDSVERQARARLQAERRCAAVRLDFTRHQAGGFQRGLPRSEPDLRQQYTRDDPVRRGDADQLRGGPQVDLGRRAHALQRRRLLLRLRGLPDLPLRAPEPGHLQHRRRGDRWRARAAVLAGGRLGHRARPGHPRRQGEGHPEPVGCAA